MDSNFGPSQGMSQIRTVGAERDIGRRKRRFLYGGTDGSNPVPSTGESVGDDFGGDSNGDEQSGLAKGAELPTYRRRSVCGCSTAPAAAESRRACGQRQPIILVVGAGVKFSRRALLPLVRVGAHE